MSLINCIECHHKISSNAKFCPNCGNPIENAEDSFLSGRTPTKNGEINTKPANTIIGAALGLIGFFLIFALPPIGLSMLVVGGVFSSLSKKIPALTGLCPHCKRLISIPTPFMEASCPLCKENFINETTHFAKPDAPSLFSEEEIKLKSTGNVAEIIKYYGLTYDDGQYCYGGYRHNSIEEAIQRVKLDKRLKESRK